VGGFNGFYGNGLIVGGFNGFYGKRLIVGGFNGFCGKILRTPQLVCILRKLKTKPNGCLGRSAS
jgi:hypothetical protein